MAPVDGDGLLPVDGNTFGQPHLLIVFMYANDGDNDGDIDAAHQIMFMYGAIRVQLSVDVQQLCRADISLCYQCKKHYNAFKTHYSVCKMHCNACERHYTACKMH